MSDRKPVAESERVSASAPHPTFENGAYPAKLNEFGYPTGRPRGIRTNWAAKERREDQAAKMRAVSTSEPGDWIGGNQPRGKRPWSARSKPVERSAREIESRRQFRYEIVADYEGQTIVMGYCSEAHGGYWLALAKLMDWIDNPRVCERL